MAEHAWSPFGDDAQSVGNFSWADDVVEDNTITKHSIIATQLPEVKEARDVRGSGRVDGEHQQRSYTGDRQRDDRVGDGSNIARHSAGGNTNTARPSSHGSGSAARMLRGALQQAQGVQRERPAVTQTSKSMVAVPAVAVTVAQAPLPPVPLPPRAPASDRGTPRRSRGTGRRRGEGSTSGDQSDGDASGYRETRGGARHVTSAPASVTNVASSTWNERVAERISRIRATLTISGAELELVKSAVDVVLTANGPCGRQLFTVGFVEVQDPTLSVAYYNVRSDRVPTDKFRTTSAAGSTDVAVSPTDAHRVTLCFHDVAVAGQVARTIVSRIKGVQVREGAEAVRLLEAFPELALW